MARWNQPTKQQPTKKKVVSKKGKHTKPTATHTIKRGLASLFVCLVVLVPVGFTINQWANVFGLHVFGAGSSDKRKATKLPAMNVRGIDQGDPAVKPFAQPLISVTFDDGWESVYTKAAPLFQKYGIPTTQYVLSGEEDNPGYMTFAQVKALHAAGHEIDCHTVTHPDLTTLSRDEVIAQLTGCQHTLQQKIGVPINDFAAPYGKTNASVLDAIKQTYRSERNTNGDITTNQADDQDVNVRASFDRYNIIAVTIRRETTDAQLQSAIDYAIQHNGWLVLNYHDIDDGSSAFGVTVQALERQLALVSRSPVRVVPMGQVLDVLAPQKGGN